MARLNYGNLNDNFMELGRIRNWWFIEAWLWLVTGLF